MYHHYYEEDSLAEPIVEGRPYRVGTPKDQETGRGTIRTIMFKANEIANDLKSAWKENTRGKFGRALMSAVKKVRTPLAAIAGGNLTGNDTYPVIQTARCTETHKNETGGDNHYSFIKPKKTELVEPIQYCIARDGKKCDHFQTCAIPYLSTRINSDALLQINFLKFRHNYKDLKFAAFTDSDEEEFNFEMIGKKDGPMNIGEHPFHIKYGEKRRNVFIQLLNANPDTCMRCPLKAALISPGKNEAGLKYTIECSQRPFRGDELGDTIPVIRFSMPMTATYYMIEGVLRRFKEVAKCVPNSNIEEVLNPVVPGWSKLPQAPNKLD